MKKFDVKVKVCFQGIFKVQADSESEAYKIVRDNAFVMRGEIGAGTANVFKDGIFPGIFDWDWPNHSDEMIINQPSKISRK